MKRYVKNIICVVIIILSIGLMVGYRINNINKPNEINDNMPEKPNESNEKPEGSNEKPEMPSEAPEKKNDERPGEQTNNTLKDYLIYGSLSLITSLVLIYLIMSKFNKNKIFISKDKIIIYILGTILSSMIFMFGINLLNYSKKELNSKEEINLDKNNKVTEKNIVLNDYDKDITISESGEYILSGSFNNSIIIETEGEVKLTLDNVNISSSKTATIIGLKATSITINLKEDTNNILSDNGTSTYDSCIYSIPKLIFEGTGTLTINGNQEEGIATETNDITFNGGTYIINSKDDGINAGSDGGTITINDGTFYINTSGDGIDSNKDLVINGGRIFTIGSSIGGDSGIDTDDGYTINGGLVVALGSDMIELPEDSSKQKVIAFELNEAITENTLVTLLKDDEVIVSFEAPKSFKTIIISNNLIEDGTYSLYTGGKNNGIIEYGIYENGNYIKGTILKENNVVTKTINLFK